MEPRLTVGVAVLVAALGSLLTGGAASTFCVVASENVATSRAELYLKRKVQSCLETKTWNDYLADQHSYFTGVSDATFLFYSGTHPMNRSLEANGVNNLLITGSSPDSVILTSSVTGLSTSLLFNNFSNVTVEGMTINLCASVNPSIQYDNGLLYFSNGTNASVSKTRLDNACNGSEIHGEWVEDLTVIDIEIVTSSQGVCGSICIYYNVSGTVRVSSSHFELHDTTCSDLFVFLNFGPWLVEDSTINIESCNFTCGNVLAINLDGSDVSVTNVHADGCGTSGSVRGACSVVGYGSLYVADSSFDGFGSALVSTNVTFAMNNTVFNSNTGLAGDITEVVTRAVALGIYSTTASLFNVRFTQNGVGNNLPDSPILLVDSSSVTLHDCNFTENLGSALSSIDSSLSFVGQTVFYKNRGYSGTAINLDIDSELIYSEGDILFQSNIATYAGGAIYIPKQPSTCPFFPSVENKPSASKRLTFDDNYAVSGGNDIYGGDLDQVVVDENTRCIEIVRESSDLPRDISSISSTPSRVCLCNNRNELDCLKIFDSREAYPGEDIPVSVVAVGQTFGTAAGYVNAQLLPLNGSEQATLDDLYQDVKAHSCNNLTYKIDAHPGLVVLVLTTKIEPVQHYGSKSEVDASIEEYNQSNRSFVPKSLLNFPVYINITIKSCPVGFNLSGTPPRCDCFDRLRYIKGVTCQISKRELYRSGTVWIGSSSSTIGGSTLGSSDNDTGAVQFSEYCPYNYCKTEEINIFNSSDEQCQWSRTGKLCGQCPDGLSLTLGVSHCERCSNTNLFLLAVFAVGGVVLVIFLKLTNLTTAGGLVNGLILYANLVKAGCYVYFPSSSSTSFLKPFQVFIDWLNLDFGIEVCFFNGLDGYWKTWLQFAFPLYLWVISLTMILLARYSSKVARLLGNNSVPVLATLFTLSYAKIFRVIITAMKFTFLEDVYGHKSTMWSYDGSIEYFEASHTILLIVAILVLLCLGLPYTCVLLFAQCLQRSPIGKVSKYVSKLQPLIDAHCGPFKDRFRYWFGLLLVVRTAPLLIGAITVTNSDKNTVLSTVVLVGVLLVLLLILQSWVYRKVYVSLSEILFLLNLLILAGASWRIPYSSSLTQGIVTAVFVGIAFLHFATIVIFSTVQHIRMVCRRGQEWVPLVAGSNIGDLSYQRSLAQSDTELEVESEDEPERESKTESTTY